MINSNLLLGSHNLHCFCSEGLLEVLTYIICAEEGILEVFRNVFAISLGQDPADIGCCPSLKRDLQFVINYTVSKLHTCENNQTYFSLKNCENVLMATILICQFNPILLRHSPIPTVKTYNL
jgi:hypothetical protein